MDLSTRMEVGELHYVETWQLSSETMTVMVRTVDIGAGPVITQAAPVVRRFERQPLANLTGWMRGQGGYRETRLSVYGTRR
jgi:hypothetical protein